MNITVAICTWNRSKLLEQTLVRLGDVHVPSGVTWQVLVVDNNCTDDTASVFESHREILPLRVVKESQQGLCHARNRALAEAESDWVLFIDDDVLVKRDWLASYCDGLLTVPDITAFVGGEVVPWFEIAPIATLVQGIPTVGQGFCGVSIPATRQITAADRHLPVGANFGLRKSCLHGMSFDSRLDVIGRQRLTGGEQDLFDRLLDAGVEGYWINGVTVAHFVPKERLTLRYLSQHLFGLGRTGVMRHGAPAGRQFRGVPLWVMREIVEAAIAAPAYYAFNRRAEFYKCFSKFWIRAGVAWECIRHGSRKNSGGDSRGELAESVTSEPVSAH